MTTPESSSLTPGQPLPDTTVPSPAAKLPRRADGSVDWRALVRPEHLYVKGEHKETVAKLLQKPVSEIRDLGPEDVKRVPDRYLVIRKAGILELARLRGFVSQIPDVQFAQRDYVIVRTVVTWTPFENMPLTSGGVGEATPENTSEMGCRYLASNAQNRAFARAVRDYLEIDIVCSDELGRDGAEPEQNNYRTDSVTPAISSTSAPSAGPKDLSPQGTLQRTAEEAGFSFEQVKEAAQSRWDEDSAQLEQNPGYRRRIENDPSIWPDWKGVPPRDCLTLTQLIKAFKAARTEVSAAKEEQAQQESAVGEETSVAAPSPAPAEAAAPKKRTRKAPAAPVTPISTAASEPPVAAAA